MYEVKVGPAPLDRFVDVLTPERAERFQAIAARGLRAFEGRTVWNVSSTAYGGGVAEMLHTLLAYVRAVGVDTRWLVIEGDPSFFVITKRLHNLLHGQAGDGGPLGESERAQYDVVQRRNAEGVLAVARAGDVVLLHDPQTAGLVRALQDAGIHVVWRCHIGRDVGNEQTDLGWAFLRPLLKDAEGFVFSRRQYAPDWVPQDRLWVIPPSLDPFSAKNADVVEANVSASLHQVGLVDANAGNGSCSFARTNGSIGTVRADQGLLYGGQPLPRDARMVLQVSRWDRLKDMSGVMRGFARGLDRLPGDVHLMLAGPDVAAVSDDPEGAEVLAECLEQWRSLDPPAQSRIHLCGLPMDDPDENAHLVNALQRYATVVVQKSTMEGFGLTVTEPMWKGRPVVASAVGGIQDQIVDGTSGLLLSDPSDLDAFVGCVAALLADPATAARLGAAAHERVRDRFLPDRHLSQYVDLLERLVR